ncbi:putative uncharacterized protein [Waddlia chondrophila 2032/99]|uniref:Uncharacterized protein n=2 Tax=Waddlia chondrophila TaxID=71667 RepID=D6YTB9_WADCW|nr:conserved hypothetical protein [Waddlia chondrophila WSU 86-1044]CCB91622.1 putative uncharacterized protein [Waddlia chondrophila 2032/99]
MRKDTVRLTFDFPSNLHTFLKMAAAKEGVSMRAYIVDSLMHKMDHEDKVDLDKDAFRKELAKMTKKDAKLMKDLSVR